jgi:hypothetical protein
MRRARTNVSFGAPPSLISSRNFESLPVPQVALRTLKPSGDSAIRTTHKSDRHIRCPPACSSPCSGTTAGDGPVTERRGSRLVYRKSARDAFLSGNGTDPRHGRKTIAARPTMDRSYESTKPGPPPEEESGSHTPALCRRLVRKPQITPKTFPLNPERPRKPTIRAAKSCRLQQRPA